MRTIKFRAWYSGEMHEDYISSETGYENWGAVNEPSYEIHREIQLMQFTGLQDKNGKEIYEGDVVKHLKSPMMNQALQVFYSASDAGFYINRSGSSTDASFGFIPYPSSEWQVIGNIYENPKLIKQ